MYIAVAEFRKRLGRTLRVNYPLPNKKLPGGETNPATEQIDFYIRSPQQNPKNRPKRLVFVHLGVEITWRFCARDRDRRRARRPGTAAQGGAARSTRPGANRHTLLRKDPDRRFQSAADLKVALQELREESESAPRPTPVPAARRRGRAAIAAVAVLALVLVLVWVLRKDASVPAAAEMRLLPLTSDPGEETMPSLSPDGTQVVYVALEPGGRNSNLYVLLVNSQLPTPNSQSERGRAAGVCPPWELGVGGWELTRLAIESGPRLRLTNDSGRSGPTQWSPDGNSSPVRIAASSSFHRSGGPERRILEWGQFRDYCWLPDGRRVLFASAASPPVLQLLNVQTEQIQPVAEVPHLQPVPFGAPLAVSQDGELIATGERDPVFADQTTRTVYRLPRPVALGLSVTPDESWLLFTQLDGSGADLMLIDGFSGVR